MTDNRIWYKKISLSESALADKKYYDSLSAEQRLSIVQELREMAGKFGYESPKRLRRVFRIIKQE